MKSKNQTDSVDIGIKHDIEQVGSITWMSFYNYDGLGSNSVQQVQYNEWTYRETRFGGLVWAHGFVGYMKTTSTDQTELFFTIHEPGHPNYKAFHYFGRRIGDL